MCKTGIVEILQTLGRTMQLPSPFSGVSGGESEITHQFQSVGMMTFNVFHDGPVPHPLRHGNEMSFFHVLLNPKKFQDIRVG